MISAAINCPDCGQPIESHALLCRSCGSFLALAAVQAEQKLHHDRPVPEGYPLAPEVLVPRLGDSLVEIGVMNTAMLEIALAYQRREQEAGRNLLLGQALRELDLIDQETLDKAVTTQIFHLQNALQRTNQELETRVKERTHDLEQALDKLAELNQLKANFIANISHELRTPLLHIKGYLDILLDDGLGPLNSDQREAVETISRAETRLERLIEDLIQFSLATRGELHLELAVIDLNEILKSVLNQISTRIEKKQLKVQVDLEEKLPPVVCDREKLTWVLLQLMDNAIKFNQQDGLIGVETSTCEDGVVVEISDSGIGIATEELNNIYTPFHQLDGSSTRRYGGTGLGLALSSRILQAHGSDLKAESMAARGSRFSFILPVIDPERKIDKDIT